MPLYTAGLNETKAYNLSNTSGTFAGQASGILTSNAGLPLQTIERVSKDRGFGYTAGGGTAVEKYDDVANTWTAKTSLASRSELAGFSLNGYGYPAGGDVGGAASAVTEKYDDVANTWTAKANLNTARYGLTGFSLNGFGYTAGGAYQGSGQAAVEKYDDVANTWTAKTSLGTARKQLAGFSLNGYGYTAGGDPAVTEKYDDVANTWTAKANLNTARYGLTGFSLNGYGYTAGGWDASAVTEKYDDVANTWTAKANLNTGRSYLSGFSLNGYGYTAGGYIAAVSAVTEKYDDVANTWTAKANLNTARNNLSGFSLGHVSDVNFSPELINLTRMLSGNISLTQSGTISTQYTSTIVQFKASFPIIPQVMLTPYAQATVWPTTITSGSFTFNASSAVAHAWTAIVKTTTLRG